MCLENKKAKSPFLLNSTMVVRRECFSEKLSFKRKKKKRPNILFLLKVQAWHKGAGCHDHEYIYLPTRIPLQRGEIRRHSAPTIESQFMTNIKSVLSEQTLQYFHTWLRWHDVTTLVSISYGSGSPKRPSRSHYSSH